MKRFAIAVGHRSKAQGAYSPHLCKTEFEFNSPIAESLSDIADIYYRPNTIWGSEGGRIVKLVNEINLTKYDMALELHFDSFPDPKANGASALHYITNRRTKEAAARFTQMMYDTFGIRRRSNVPVTTRKQNGGTWIIDNYADALLVEPFFGSNLKDCQAINGCEEEYSQLLRELLLTS